ncbi:MAG: hypothetical protein ACAI44_34010 [Candidatus Sericytochromatia bacterium]
MKMRHLPAALLSVLLLAACGQLRISSVRPEPARFISFQPRYLTPEAALAFYDHNHDARLSPSEIQSSCILRQDRSFEFFDDDRDGFITLRELLKHSDAPCSWEDKT